jgi:hypothetical protein
VFGVGGQFAARARGVRKRRARENIITVWILRELVARLEDGLYWKVVVRPGGV